MRNEVPGSWDRYRGSLAPHPHRRRYADADAINVTSPDGREQIVEMLPRASGDDPKPVAGGALLIQMESDRDVPVEVRLGFSNQPQLEFNWHVRVDIAASNSDPIGFFEARVAN